MDAHHSSAAATRCPSRDVIVEKDSHSLQVRKSAKFSCFRNVHKSALLSASFQNSFLPKVRIAAVYAGAAGGKPGEDMSKSVYRDEITHNVTKAKTNRLCRFAGGGCKVFLKMDLEK